MSIVNSSKCLLSEKKWTVLLFPLSVQFMRHFVLYGGTQCNFYQASSSSKRRNKNNLNICIHFEWGENSIPDHFEIFYLSDRTLISSYHKKENEENLFSLSGYQTHYRHVYRHEEFLFITSGLLWSSSTYLVRD